jgi:hypothetical protein
MNRSSSGFLLSIAIDGLIRYKVVEGLSDTTIVSCKDHLGRFLDFTNDIPITNIGSSKIEEFLYMMSSS